MTLSFEGNALKYDTSVVRSGLALGSAKTGRMPGQGARFDAGPPGEHWRQSALYNPASDEGRASPSPDYDYDDGYGEVGHGGASPPHTYSPSYSAPYHHSESRRMNWPSPRAGGSGGRPALQSSWAAEADKILAEAQAKIDEALQRERLLQDTLDMLREKNAVNFW